MNTSTAASLIGISERTLSRWCHRGYVKPCAGGNGKGDTRWWTDRDVLVAQLCRELLEAGIEPAQVGEATALASKAPDWFDQILIVGERTTVCPLESIAEATYWERGVFRVVDLGSRERQFARST